MTMNITLKYLQEHPDEIFVYGDNTIHKGKGGAAIFRDELNTYGFITKKLPCNDDKCFFKPEEYERVFEYELRKLARHILDCPGKTFLISKLGAGLANKYGIFETVIEPNIKRFLIFVNVKFLW